MRSARWNKDNAFSSVLSGPGCGTCHLFPGAVAFLSACLQRRWDKPPRLGARRIVSHTGPGLCAFSDYDLQAAITRTVLFLKQWPRPLFTPTAQTCGLYWRQVWIREKPLCLFPLYSCYFLFSFSFSLHLQLPAGLLAPVLLKLGHTQFPHELCLRSVQSQINLLPFKSIRASLSFHRQTDGHNIWKTF